MAEDDRQELPSSTSLDELVEFFDTHDMGEHEVALPEAQFEVDLQRVRRMLNYSESTRKLIDRLNEKSLIFEFFFVFSRFEYALLSLSYIRPDKTYVFADWDRFATELDDSFKLDLFPTLPEAVEFYEQHPPKKQVVELGRLDSRILLPRKERGGLRRCSHPFGELETIFFMARS